MKKAKGNEFISKLKNIDPGRDIMRAFESVDRRLFFDPFFHGRVDMFDPIPVGLGEFSDDVGILARMLKLLNPSKKWNIIEIGTGSGYATALLSMLTHSVLTVEYHESLASDAKKRLLKNGFLNIKFLAGDCSELDDTAGSFDAAIIHPACTHSPYSVLNLLKRNGIAVYPMGPVHMQQITLYRNTMMRPEDNPFKRFRFFETCTCPVIRGQYGVTSPELDVIIEPK